MTPNQNQIITKSVVVMLLGVCFCSVKFCDLWEQHLTLPNFKAEPP